MTTAEIAFDPFTAVRDPECFDKMRRLRQTAPVLEVMPGIFYLSRMDDVMKVYLDADLWINGGGHRVTENMSDPEEQPIWELDSPRHGPVRRLAMIALKPRSINAAEPWIKNLCRELVDNFAGRGEADLVQEMSIPLPSRIIAHLIGFPVEDAPVLRAWIDAGLSTPAAAGAPMGDRYDSPEYRKLDDYTKGMMDKRRADPNPPDDMLTRMLQFQDESGKQFSDREIFAQTRALVSAGNETTTHLIGNTLWELARRPELYARVRADRELVHDLVEESLRMYSPIQFIFRQASRDTEINGVRIARGQKVVLGMASANRDESVYSDPDEFRIDRGKLLDHVAFGRGSHLCIGSALARMECVSAVDAIMDRIPEMGLKPGWEYVNTNFSTARGPRTLEVTFPKS